MTRPRKILFAAVDIGYRIELYSNYIREHLSEELEAESLSIYVLPTKHYKTSYTYEFHYHERSRLYRWVRSMMNFCSCLFRYDIFHFISGETLLTRKLRPFELAVYKLFGKRVVMQFVGADIRSPEYLRWKDGHIHEFLQGRDDFPKCMPWQKRLIRDAKKYADAILVSTPDLLDIIPQAKYYPVVIDLEKFRQELRENPPAPPQTEEIVILHCPSNIQVKGTSHIHSALERVQKLSPYPVKLVLPAANKKNDGKLYSVSRYDLFRLFQEADIIIDQMVIGWYGLQAVEGLIAGKEVICHIDKKLEHYLYPGSPVVPADADNLEEVVLSCIRKVAERRAGKAAEKISWVKAHHTIGNNHDVLLQAWGINSK